MMLETGHPHIRYYLTLVFYTIERHFQEYGAYIMYFTLQHASLKTKITKIRNYMPNVFRQSDKSVGHLDEKFLELQIVCDWRLVTFNITIYKQFF